MRLNWRICDLLDGVIGEGEEFLETNVFFSLRVLYFIIALLLACLFSGLLLCIAFLLTVLLVLFNDQFAALLNSVTRSRKTL